MTAHSELEAAAAVTAAVTDADAFATTVTAAMTGTLADSSMMLNW